MAIKERKQITGTTAQIDAYEGHEGQIVWDKDKKTFVGMSGTAGKNYPLAPQAYVDTQFLPLSGGTLTGEAPIIRSSNSKIVFDERPTDRGLYIQTHSEASLENPLLLLRAKESTSADAGQFVLNAVAKNKVIYTLRGDPSDGALSWDNRAISTIAKSSAHECVRYQETGLQICWGVAHIPASGVLMFNFPKPFRDAGSRLYTQIIGNESAAVQHYNVLIDSLSSSSVKFVGISGNRLGGPLGIFWMAIGYWRF